MKKKEKLVIGVLGGMGTYATIHLFEEYAKVFSAEKEWERPRIIIDNRSTMPSRVRAFLFDEKKDQLIEEMEESISNLIKSGSTKIILACNTSHLFLPQIMEKNKNITKDKIENIIDNCIKKIINDNVKEIYLLASEGTIQSKVYQNKLEKAGIICKTPLEEEYTLLRECIEAVKQNKYSKKIEKIFEHLINKYPYCILGCTELPILYKNYKYKVNKDIYIYDPLLITLKLLKEEYDNV